MAHAILFHQTGGPEVLSWEEVAVGHPGPGQVRIRHVAVGLNFADTYFRTGLYPVPLPQRHRGGGVRGRGGGRGRRHQRRAGRPGDLHRAFGTCSGPIALERITPAAPLIRLPDGIGHGDRRGDDRAGLTAAYTSLRRIWPLTAGDSILLHAAAGGVGLIASQWAKLLGLTVIGTVSTEAKAELARDHGCDHVIQYGREDVAWRVRALTGGAGVSVVYDSVGEDTFAGSLDSLKRRGLLVCVGTASGPVPPLDVAQLAAKGSVFVTRPSLADYIADPAEKAELVDELFGHVAAGRIRIEIHQRYRLEDAAQAHRDPRSAPDDRLVDLRRPAGVKGQEDKA